MKFYLYINNQYVLQKVEVFPTVSDMLDETLDTLSFVLKVTKDDTPFAPMTKAKCELEDNDNTIKYFVVATDTVEIFTSSPQRFKHRLTCVENKRVLSKYLVRNSQFTQPSYKYKESFVGISAGTNALRLKLNEEGKFSTLTRSYYSGLEGNYESLKKDSRDKIARTYFEIDIQVAQSDADTPTSAKWINGISTQSDLTSLGLTFDLSVVRLYYKQNGTWNNTTISLSDIGGTLYFNRPIYCPKIKNILNLSGVDEVYLAYTKTTEIIDSATLNCFTLPFSGEWQPQTEKFVAFVMCQIKIRAEVYYYSAYDILNLLLERQKQTTALSSPEPLFKLPFSSTNLSLYTLLTNAIVPNFTFTQLTMYECVDEVFRLFDATFTMDDEGYLDIKYFNDRNKTPITPKLTSKVLSTSEDKYTNGYVSYYQDARLDVFYPNKNGYAPAKGNELGVPSKENDFKIFTDHPISEIIDAKVGFTGGLRTLLYNGYSTDLTVDRSCSNQRLNQVLVEGIMPFYIGRYIVEKDLWSILDGSENIYRTNTSQLLQNNTFFFIRNGNEIDLSYTWQTATGVKRFSFILAIANAGARQAGVKELINGGDTSLGYAPQSYRAPNQQPIWGNIVFNVEYYASLDGRVKVESLINKFPGDTLVDQTNGAVDLNKMGLNILGIALKSGEPSLSVKHNIIDVSKRIKKGDIINYKGEIWIANACNYTLLKDGYVQGDITFVKNFNALSLVTRVLREKRMSNISQSLTLKSEDNYIDHVYISSYRDEDMENQEGWIGISYNAASRNNLLRALTNTFIQKYSIRQPSIATINAPNTDLEISGYMSEGVISSIDEDDFESILQIPIENISQYRSLTVEFENETGTTATNTYRIENDVVILISQSPDERNFDHVRYTITGIQTYPYINLPLVRYGSGNALCFEMTFNSSISAGNQSVEKDGWFGHGYFTNVVKYTDDIGFRDEFNVSIYSSDEIVAFDHYFPEISQESLASEIKYLRLQNYEVYKQPNEVFALNYELMVHACDPINEFIGSKFINDNYLVSDSHKENKKLYLYYTPYISSTFNYSVLDTKGEGDRVEIPLANVTLSSTVYLTITVPILLPLCRTWALCDENGDILFASNKPLQGSEIRLYFYTSHKRLD